MTPTADEPNQRNIKTHQEWGDATFYAKARVDS